MRSLKVILTEKSPVLGGKWRLASSPPGCQELFNFLYWLFKQARSKGVEIRTGDEATPETVREIAPDVIVVCTGSIPRIPNIPGINLPNVVLAQDALEGTARLGEKVIVVGGGGVGVETASYLANKWSSSPETVAFLLDYEAVEKELALSLLRKGHQVTLVEQLDRIGEGLGQGTKWVLKKELALSKVNVMTNAPVTEILPEGVAIEKKGSRQVIPGDTVVLATGFINDDTFYKKVKDLAKEVYIVGNKPTVGHAIDFVGEAFEIALKI